MSSKTLIVSWSFVFASFLSVASACFGQTTNHSSIVTNGVHLSKSIPSKISFEIPELDDVNIDANPQEWKDRGFRVDVLLGNTPNLPSKQEFEPRFRLGWNTEGLLILAEIADDNISESNEPEQLFRGTSIELVLAEPNHEWSNNCVVEISPGLDGKHQTPRCYWYRKSANTSVDPKVASARIKGGYVLEALIPWENIGYMPSETQQMVEFQFFAFHVSAKSKNVWSEYWYPDDLSWRIPSSTFALRCSSNASESIECAVRPVDTKSVNSIRLRAIGTQDLLGKTFDLYSRRTRVDYQATFSQDGDHTSIDFLVQYPHNGTDANGLDFYGFVNGELVAFFPRINWRTEMRDALSSFRFAGPLVFQGTTFPNFKWPSADEQTSLFGNESKFSIKYWNDQYEPVSMADKPGRYGAVVEISNGQSIVARRMMTLCRVPDSIGGWNLARDGMDALPNTVALLYRSLPPSPIPPASTDLEIPFNPARAYPDDPIYSMYLANLSESSPSATPGLADHEWWVGFRHRFYGFEKKYPNLLARLAPTTAPSEESSPMLREGTPAEAGMKDDVVDKLDALFSSGVNEFPDEPLAVCVAHNGVVFFHRAYGKLEDGSNMTVEVPTLTSAIGKVITGIVAMEFIDRGFLNLDRPLDEYVPAFAMVHKSDFGDTLTLHYFFTHQAGLERWARQFNDIEEVVANQGPFLRKGYTYSSVGYFCAGSIMEEMSGQPFRVLTKKLVFEPLGMLNAEQPSPDGDGTMSVLDLAKMGQMLLNHGTYGHVRLVSEKSFQQMLPKPGWGVRGGIGLEQAGAGIVEGDAILPPDSIGHAAINSGVFEVIPSKNLVIVVGAMRHRPGAFATKYQEKVFEAILSSIK